jgi:hypothetical protein
MCMQFLPGHFFAGTDAVALAGSIGERFIKMGGFRPFSGDGWRSGMAP